MSALGLGRVKTAAAVHGYPSIVRNHPVGWISGFFGGEGRGQNAPLTSLIGAERGLVALMASIPVIKAHVSRGFPLPADRRLGKAGAGGARKRLVRLGICPNIHPGTATSAIWKVT
ncbi:MAG: hypothetical protein QF893_00940 [Alphaproteobacteria bacterium]|jgi:hypothetical protein|nr:hypothetical protein [Alphaproteobacteria bacterium]